MAKAGTLDLMRWWACFGGYRRAFDDTASNTEGLSFPAFYATYKNVFINTVGGVVDGTLQGIVTFGLKFDLTPR